MKSTAWSDFLFDTYDGTPVWVLLIPVWVVILGGMIGGGWAAYNRRKTERAAQRQPLPPTWPEMWAHIKTQDDEIDLLKAQVHVLLNYSARVQAAGGPQFTDEEREKLGLA